MIFSLLFFVCCALAGVLPAVWADLRGRSIARAFAAGGPVGAPAEVSARPAAAGAAGPVRGDLWMTARTTDPVYFVSGTAVVPLSRHGRVRDVVRERARGFRLSAFVGRDTVVYEEPCTGHTWSITVDATVTAVLRSALVPPGAALGAGEPDAAETCAPATDAFRMPLARRVRIPGFAALLLTGALALTLFGVHTFGLGREVTATVTGVRDGQCGVVWQDPWDTSRTQHARVDCYGGEKAGEALRIGARPWPARGEAADLEDSRFMLVLGVSVAGLASLAGIGSASLRSARGLRVLRRCARTGTKGTVPGSVVVPWWSWAAAVTGLAALGLVTLAYGFGRPVRAEVLRTTEYGTCGVAWADPWNGARETAEVDCDGVPRGDLLEISALPWPLRGEAFDRDLTPLGLGGLVAAGAGATLLGTCLHSRRSRRGTALVAVAVAAAPAGATPGAPRALPRGGGDRVHPGDVLTRTHLTAVSRLLLGRETPAPGRRRPEPDPRSGPWWRSPALRRLTFVSGVSWGALVVLAVAVLWSGRWWVTALQLTTEPPRTAVAKVEYLQEELPLEPWLLPGEAEMSFVTEDGRRVVTDIVHGRPAPSEGDTVGIEYAPGHPSAARIPGDPGFARGLWGSGVVAALALTRLVWCAVSTGRVLRRLLRAARLGTARSFDYLLLAGGAEPATEGPLLVLFAPGSQRPEALTDVVPEAVLLPAEGTLELRSAPGDDGAAVAWIQGEPVWPTSPLTVLSEDGAEDAFRAYVTELVPPDVVLDVATAPDPRPGSSSGG
ncbi:hypothetical protein ACF065_18420 [Streptomyces sp. NPDC015232]|uniref:hypothetical protein n=1 Tax=unclassified Streptomyces TaxID=2593676 RepID=UPI0036F50391